MKTAKLYLVRINTEDGEIWEIFACEADTIEKAELKARKNFMNEGMMEEEDVIELYEQPTVCGYKVTLKK